MVARDIFTTIDPSPPSRWPHSSRAAASGNPLRQLRARSRRLVSQCAYSRTRLPPVRCSPLVAAARRLAGILDPLETHLQMSDHPTDGRDERQAARIAAAGGATDAFLSWLIHELRSPLNACVMWLDVLALAPQPDKLTKAVEALKRNLARQTKLVNDLNDAARAASRSGLEVGLGPLDLVALLNRSIDAWQAAALGKQITFDHRIEATAAPLQGDSERLVQALNHLIENAVNSTPTGGRLELRARRLDDTCVVEIEDTGGLLSAEDAAHLFEPLWRSHASTKSRSGLGLGLAVAHHIVSKHGGTLTATNGSAGAVFTLTFPLEPSTAPEAAARRKSV